MFNYIAGKHVLIAMAGFVSIAASLLLFEQWRRQNLQKNNKTSPYFKELAKDEQKFE